MIREGDPAPDFTLDAVAGGRVSLRDFRGRAVLLIFLRHLGWLVCLDHVARVRQRQKDIDEAGGVLAVLAPEPVEPLAALAGREGWAGPVLADPHRIAYRAFGLGRLPWHRVFTLRAAAMYLGFFLHGRRPGPAGQDVMQQGGDFIVDGEGIVRLAYAGRSTDDRPPADDLIRCLRSSPPPRAPAVP